MKTYLYIAAVGFLGAVSRFFIKKNSLVHYSGALPLGTLFVNITGAFLLAFILGFSMDV